jgi:PAS domain S-box-containing protein
MPTKRKLPPFHSLDEDHALRKILESTSAETGEMFFVVLVENLVEALGVHGAWVTEYLEDAGRLRSLAMVLGGKRVDHYEYAIADTPCEPVIDEDRLIHIPDRVIDLYPRDPDLPEAGAMSYLGVPLHDLDGSILGHLAVLDDRPMPEEPRTLTVFRIFADRAAAELRRLRAEDDVREREVKLRRLVESAMDAIVELDGDLRVTMVNPAAERLFGFAADTLVGEKLDPLLTPDSLEALASIIGDLDGRARGQQYQWVTGPFYGRSAGRTDEFPAEATVSRFELDHRPFYTLILRDVNDRVTAENTIRSLRVEKVILEEEVRSLLGPGRLIGESPSMRRVVAQIEQVAGTDATVLITGETGTGKEVVARAVHELSLRGGRPLVKVNCAAIPASLIESEFFGHEKGAFTGATHKREGRFALADGGTIFLDEIGELPIDMQSMLLRVLQEGEFDPVGSSRTRTVDVRVIAATNQDLAHEIGERRFREDLYYRLNVFPIHVPPLRERGDDVALLAAAFVETLATRMGQAVRPISPGDIEQLKSHEWPGNVRELQNVIERALITSRGSGLDLAGALSGEARTGPPLPVNAETSPIRTVQELQELERDNIVRALEAAGGRVSGDRGAARMLGMNPSTLSSRIRALGIKRIS